MEKNRFFEERSRPIVLGHRGVPKLHQENTLSGFRRAVEFGVDGVELDVFKTRDNRVVVFHDRETERLTGVKGDIQEMSWEEVSKLRIQRRVDMGGGKSVTFEKEERIPLLEEVLDEFRDTLMINIELKSFEVKWSNRHAGRETAKIVRKTGSERSVILTSFDFFKLHSLEKEYPGLHSGFTYDDGMLGDVEKWIKRVPEIRSEVANAPGNQNNETLLNFICESNIIGKIIGSTVVGVEYSLIDSDTVRKFHQRNTRIGAYTLFPLDTHYAARSDLDQVTVLKRLIRRGIDWIETDDPEKVIETLINQ